MMRKIPTTTEETNYTGKTGVNLSNASVDNSRSKSGVPLSSSSFDQGFSHHFHQVFKDGCFNQKYFETELTGKSTFCASQFSYLGYIHYPLLFVILSDHSLHDIQLVYYNYVSVLNIKVHIKGTFKHIIGVAIDELCHPTILQFLLVEYLRNEPETVDNTILSSCFASKEIYPFKTFLGVLGSNLPFSTYSKIELLKLALLSGASKQHVFLIFSYYQSYTSSKTTYTTKTINNNNWITDGGKGVLQIFELYFKSNISDELKHSNVHMLIDLVPIHEFEISIKISIIKLFLRGSAEQRSFPKMYTKMMISSLPFSSSSHFASLFAKAVHDGIISSTVEFCLENCFHPLNFSSTFKNNPMEKLFDAGIESRLFHHIIHSFSDKLYMTYKGSDPKRVKCRFYGIEKIQQCYYLNRITAWYDVQKDCWNESSKCHKIFTQSMMMSSEADDKTNIEVLKVGIIWNTFGLIKECINKLVSPALLSRILDLSYPHVHLYGLRYDFMTSGCSGCDSYNELPYMSLDSSDSKYFADKFYVDPDWSIVAHGKKIIREAILSGSSVQHVSSILKYLPKSVHHRISLNDGYPLHLAIRAGSSFDIIKLIMDSHPEALTKNCGDPKCQLPLDLMFQRACMNNDDDQFSCFLDTVHRHHYYLCDIWYPSPESLICATVNIIQCFLKHCKDKNKVILQHWLPSAARYSQYPVFTHLLSTVSKVWNDNPSKLPATIDVCSEKIFKKAMMSKLSAPEKVTALFGCAYMHKYSQYRKNDLLYFAVKFGLSYKVVEIILQHLDISGNALNIQKQDTRRMIYNACWDESFLHKGPSQTSGRFRNQIRVLQLLLQFIDKQELQIDSPDKEYSFNAISERRESTYYDLFFNRDYCFHGSAIDMVFCRDHVYTYEMLKFIKSLLPRKWDLASYPYLLQNACGRFLNKRVIELLITDCSGRERIELLRSPILDGGNTALHYACNSNWLRDDDAYFNNLKDLIMLCPAAVMVRNNAGATPKDYMSSQHTLNKQQILARDMVTHVENLYRGNLDKDQLHDAVAFFLSIGWNDGIYLCLSACLHNFSGKDISETPFFLHDVLLPDVLSYLGNRRTLFCSWKLLKEFNSYFIQTLITCSRNMDSVSLKCIDESCEDVKFKVVAQPCKKNKLKRSCFKRSESEISSCTNDCYKIAKHSH